MNNKQNTEAILKQNTVSDLLSFLFLIQGWAGYVFSPVSCTSSLPPREPSVSSTKQPHSRELHTYNNPFENMYCLLVYIYIL